MAGAAIAAVVGSVWILSCPLHSTVPSLHLRRSDWMEQQAFDSLIHSAAHGTSAASGAEQKCLKQNGPACASMGDVHTASAFILAINPAASGFSSVGAGKYDAQELAAKFGAAAQKVAEDMARCMPVRRAVVAAGDVVAYDGHHLVHRASTNNATSGAPCRLVEQPQLFLGVHISPGPPLHLFGSVTKGSQSKPLGVT